MKERDGEAVGALSRLRRLTEGDPTLVQEYLEIKASIMLENTFARENFPGKSGLSLHTAQVISLYLSPQIQSNVDHPSTHLSLRRGRASDGWP